MRRGSLLITCAALFALAACQQKQEQPAARQETPHESLAELDAAPSLEQDPYAGDVHVTGAPTHAASDPVVADRMTEETTEDPAVAAEPPPEPNRRIHIIRKGDTLYGLARQYYGDSSRWKEIWTANKDHLQDPNRLEVGLKLIIP